MIDGDACRLVPWGARAIGRLILLGRLFARKFDPKDTEVLDVLDRVRGGEVSRWRKGESFNFISIRSAAAVEVAKPRDGPGGRRGLDPGDAKELCLALDEPPPKTGREPGASAGARMVPCSEEDSRQIFKLGPCSESVEIPPA